MNETVQSSLHIYFHWTLCCTWHLCCSWFAHTGLFRTVARNLFLCKQPTKKNNNQVWEINPDGAAKLKTSRLKDVCGPLRGVASFQPLGGSHHVPIFAQKKEHLNVLPLLPLSKPSCQSKGLNTQQSERLRLRFSCRRRALRKKSKHKAITARCLNRTVQHARTQSELLVNPHWGA